MSPNPLTGATGSNANNAASSTDAGSSGTEGASSSSTNDTQQPGLDANALMSQLQTFFSGQIGALETRLNARIDARSSSTPVTAPTPSFEEMCRRAEQRFDRDSRSVLHRSYTDEGLTSAQADELVLNAYGPEAPGAATAAPVQPNVAPNVVQTANVPAAGTDTTAVVATRGYREKFVAEDIFLFNGDPALLEDFITRFESIWEIRSDALYREPLMETFPKCLRNSAQKWYSSSSSELRLKDYRDWPKLKQHLHNAFAPDRASARRMADARKWDFKRETVGEYYWDKLAMMRSSYRADRQETDFVHDIYDGLPDSFQTSIRTCLMEKPTPNVLLKEMRLFETPWRNIDPKNRALRRTAAPYEQPADSVATSNALVVANQVKLTPAASGDSKGHIQTRQRQTLKESYTPNNISIVKGKRFYQLPGRDRAIELKSPCSQCGQQHFDFEHEHLTKGSAKANVVDLTDDEMDQAYYAGYRVYVVEPMSRSPSLESTASSTSSPDTSMSSAGSPAVDASGPRFEELGNWTTARSLN